MRPALHLHAAGHHVVVSTYALAIAGGVALGFVVALRRARRPDAVLVAAPLAVIAGMLVADAWHGFFHASPGLSSMGGIVGGLAVLVVSSRRLGVSTAETLDAVAPAALAGFALGRVGCFLAGCCYGRPSDLAWSVVVPELGPSARHPVQLYAAVLDALVAWWACRTAGGAGSAAGRAFVGYGAARILLESLRDPAASDLLAGTRVPVAHAGGLVLAATGLVLQLGARARGPLVLVGREGPEGRRGLPHRL